VILTDTEEQKNAFLERQMLNKIKYDELEKKLASLQKKIYEYQMNDDIRKAEMSISNVKLSTSRVVKDDMEMKLYTLDKQNQELVNNIKDKSVCLNDLMSKDFEKKHKKAREELIQVVVLLDKYEYYCLVYLILYK